MYDLAWFEKNYKNDSKYFYELYCKLKRKDNIKAFFTILIYFIVNIILFYLLIFF